MTQILKDQKESMQSRVLAILDRLKIPESRMEIWAKLWSCFPEKKWESMEQIWKKVLPDRNLSDGGWKMFEGVLKSRLEREDREVERSGYDLEER